MPRYVPQKCHFPLGNPRPQLIHSSRKSIPQMASWLVQSFWGVTIFIKHIDKTTDNRQTQTDHGTSATDHIFCYALRCGIITQINTTGNCVHVSVPQYTVNFRGGKISVTRDSVQKIKDNGIKCTAETSLGKDVLQINTISWNKGTPFKVCSGHSTIEGFRCIQSYVRCDSVMQNVECRVDSHLGR